MTVSVPESGPRVLIMLDENGKIMAVHSNENVQVLSIQHVPLKKQHLFKWVQSIGKAPAELSGNYALGSGFDNLVRQHFVNRVFKLFGR